MKKKTDEQKIYHNQKLMDDTNKMFVRIKTHLFNLGDETFKTIHTKPNNDELDQLMNSLLLKLKK